MSPEPVLIMTFSALTVSRMWTSPEPVSAVTETRGVAGQPAPRLDRRVQGLSEMRYTVGAGPR